MVADVQSYIKGWEICELRKTQNIFRKPVMGKQNRTERPFQRLFTDFMGPYPHMSDGNVYVCLDHFKKFVFLKPIRKATSAEVIKFLEGSSSPLWCTGVFPF